MITRNKLITALIMLLLLILIAILASGVLRKSRLDESSREFAIQAIPIILHAKPLDVDLGDLEDAPELEEPPTAAETFANFAHPQLLELRSMDDLGNYLFSVTQNLGPLEIVQSISGSSEVSLLDFNNQTPSASYELEATFSGGTAQIRVDMLMEQGEWLMTEFSVETDLLSD